MTFILLKRLAMVLKGLEEILKNHQRKTEEVINAPEYFCSYFVS